MEPDTTRSMRFRDQIIGNDPVCRQGHPVGAILTASCDGGDIIADLAAVGPVLVSRQRPAV